MLMRGNTLREMEEQRFNPLAAFLVTGVALFLGVYLPKLFPRFEILDLPLLIVIFYSVAWRSPIAGTLIGAFIGIVQALPTNEPIGIEGIAKCIVGYAAASISLRIDVENIISRIIFSFGFSLLQSAILFSIRHWMLDLPDTPFFWLHELIRAGILTAISLPVYFLLDRTRSSHD